MTSPPAGSPRILLVGGGGGLVGRAVLHEFSGDHLLRSVHRHPTPRERERGVEWVEADVGSVRDWSPLLKEVDIVLNLAWYRSGSARRFRPLAEGLLRLVTDAQRSSIRRFVHLSVPDAPRELEERLPYLSFKRQVDRAIEASGLPYLILRPTMLFGPRDVLLTAMMRVMHRYRRFPIFGDGAYHLSPLASSDLARILRREIARPGSRSVLLGGPRRYTYRELTDLLWKALGLRPRYWEVSPANSVRLARLLEVLGSHLLYVYEVRWLLSDMLGLDPYPGLEPPLLPVEPFIEAEARRFGSARSSGRPASRQV